MGRDTIQLEDAVSTIAGEYLLEFTSEYGIPESLHPELACPEEPIEEFSEGKVGVYTKFFEFANYHMDLFNLISSPNPAKVKTEMRPYATHEVPLLTVTTSRVIKMEDTAVASGSSRTPSALEKSSLDFANEDPPHMITEMGGITDQVWDRLSHEIPPVETATTTKVVQEPGLEKEVAAMGPPINKRCQKVLLEEKSQYNGINGSTFFTSATQETPTDATSVSDQKPLSYVKPQPHPEQDVAQKTPRDPYQKWLATGVKICLSTEFRGPGNRPYVSTVYGSPGSIYHWRIQARKGEIKRLDQEIKSLRTVEAEVHGLHNRKKNLETLLEAEVSNLQAHVMGEEKIKAAFEEFKKYEDDRVEQRCAEMDARLDKLSVDFDEELYPHMLTAFAGLVKGVRKGLEYGIEHGKVGRDLEAVEAYDPEAHSKYAKALQVLKDLKYPLVDQLEKLKDAPMELIMASLHLENLWAVKEEMLLEDAIAANISRAEKKKKYRVVCGTHGVGSAHHARSDGILVFAPTITPQGLAILLANAATQTKVANKEEEPHPRL
ncbi:hypothetical protein Tco_0931758 [Tanacetum coccineum]